MKNMLRDIFSESSTISSMRVMSFIVCMTACYIAIKDASDVAMVTVLLGTAFGAKVSQKIVESKSSNKPSDQ